MRSFEQNDITKSKAVRPGAHEQDMTRIIPGYNETTIPKDNKNKS